MSSRSPGVFRLLFKWKHFRKMSTFFEKWAVEEGSEKRYSDRRGEDV